MLQLKPFVDAVSLASRPAPPMPYASHSLLTPNDAWRFTPLKTEIPIFQMRSKRPLDRGSPVVISAKTFVLGTIGIYRAVKIRICNLDHGSSM
jgi:hypothetical protein